MNLSQAIDTFVSMSLAPFTSTVLLRLLSAGVYAIIGFLIISIIMRVIKSLLNDAEITDAFQRLGIKKHMLDFLTGIVRYYLYFLLIVIILGQLGVSSILTDVLVFVMIFFVIIIIILSLRNIIPNAAAGLYISSTKVIERGERIKVGNVSGRVSDIDLLHTVLDRKHGEKVIVPNSLILKSNIIKKK